MSALPSVRWATCEATARGVGCSKIRVGESGRCNACSMRLASSGAEMESMPTSMKGASRSRPLSPWASIVMRRTMACTSGRLVIRSPITWLSLSKIGFSCSTRVPRSLPVPWMVYVGIPLLSITVGSLSILARPMRMGLPVGPLGMASMCTSTCGLKRWPDSLMPARMASMVGGSWPALVTQATPTTSP